MEWSKESQMSNVKFFEILKQEKKTKARIGNINTSHGKILTPGFVPVGSQASVKSLTPRDLEEIGVQVFFVNTYHLYLRPGAEIIQKLGGIHQFMGWNGPIMSDSGGFQVFSLGKKQKKVRAPLFSETRAGVNGKSKSNTPSLSEPPIRNLNEISNLNLTATQYSSKRVSSPSLVAIDYNGVTFRSHLDGSEHRFTPEKSIEIQQKLGTDMMVAFDECAPYPVDYDYAKTAMERTHRWGLRSLKAFQTKLSKKPQFLFGVVQGSVYKDLRQESAKFVASLPFDGIAIGGAAVGESKQEMRQVLDWVMPILPKNRPVHLLGVGEIDDIFAAMERGIDTMDCVMPTRLARMGYVLVKCQSSNGKCQNYNMDITKTRFTEDPRPIDENCDCYVCQNFSRAYINHLFRTRELLAYRLATYHNLSFMEKLFMEIREAIKKGELLKLKKQWLQK